MDVNVRLLRYALTLARHRHFGRAARALDISQPALSRGIATLERDFGVRVFERSRRDVTATRAGEDVLKMADELIAKIDAFSSRLNLVRDGRVTRLRIASSAYIHDIAVRPAAAHMVKAHPSVRLELLEREWFGTLESLMANRADFAIMDPSVLSGMPTMRVESLGKLMPSYICRAGHPLVGRHPLRADDVRQFPFAMMALPSARAGLFDDLDSGSSTDAGTDSIMPSIAVSSCRTIFEIVAASDAITVGHRSQVSSEITAGRLALLDLPFKKKNRIEFAIVYRREYTLPPVARTFIGLIRSGFRAIEMMDV
jgi:DNA-binding transcriptional LysR family regulator